MLTFETVTLKLRRSESMDNQIMIDLHCESPAPEGEPDYHRPMWYCTLTLDEFRALVTKGTIASDGYRRIEQHFGYAILFYNVGSITGSTKGQGKAEVEFYKMEIPHFVQRVLLRYLTWITKPLGFGCDHVHDQLVIKLSKERRERWLRLYGAAKGKLEFKVCGDVTETFLAKCLAEDPDGKGRLAQNVEHVKQIALNSTQAFWETATLKLAKDWDGFYWEAYRPSGARIMNGGIINHGKDKPDWSIHT
jgi:hypothetical protein